MTALTHEGSFTYLNLLKTYAYNKTLKKEYLYSTLYSHLMANNHNELGVKRVPR